MRIKNKEWKVTHFPWGVSFRRKTSAATQQESRQCRLSIDSETTCDRTCHRTSDNHACVCALKTHCGRGQCCGSTQRLLKKQLNEGRKWFDSHLWPRSTFFLPLCNAGFTSHVKTSLVVVLLRCSELLVARVSFIMMKSAATGSTDVITKNTNVILDAIIIWTYFKSDFAGWVQGHWDFFSFGFWWIDWLIDWNLSKQFGYIFC